MEKDKEKKLSTFEYEVVGNVAFECFMGWKLCIIN